MKLFALLFSFYILTLSCRTCCGNEYDAKNLSAPISNQHSSEHTDTEICSPFCICACCASFFNFQESCNTIIKKSLEPLDYFSYFLLSIITGKLISIWQPPKMS